MKKLFYSLSLLLILCLFSCTYDYHKFFFRGPHVDVRAKEIKELSAPVTTDVQINFLVVTDLHFGGKKERQEELFFKSLKNKKIDFILFLGDLVDTGFEDCYLESETFVKKLKSNLLEPDIPFYILLGNHDLYQDGYDYWKELSFSTNKEATYYHFTTPMNSEKTEYRSWYFLDTASGILGYNQLNNFKELVEKDKNKKFVLTHYPIYADMTMFDFFRLSDTRERALLIEICDKNNVDLVFSGHWHSGGRYDFGNFTEFCFKSFCENRDNESQWTLVTLDESAQNVQFDNYLVTNGKLDVNTVNYRF